MPKLGFNMDEGQLVKWHKAEGDAVKKGEVVFEIQTDKTTMEIEATSDGVLLAVLVDEGQTVPVTLPIAVVGAAGENVSTMIAEARGQLGGLAAAGNAQPPAATDAAVPAAKPAPAAPANIAGDLKLSPRARKYAAEQGLDLSGEAVAGTGHQGGVTQRDLEKYVKSGRITPLAKKMVDAAKIEVAAISGSGIGGKIVKEDVVAAVQAAEAAPVDTAGGPEVLRTISYTGMRKVIGDRLSQSKFTAPHLYFTVSVDITELTKFRELVNKSQQQKVSYNDFVIAAVSQALQKYPEINCSLRGDKIVQYKDVNIGMAVALENGLIVPVVRRTQNKKLTAIAAETQALAEKARAGRLMPQDYQGGTFTVSNLGMFGIENFTAIINPPEAAILSVSASQKVPVVVGEDDGDQVVVRSIMKITLSVDHRLIDGLNATRFVTEVKALLEKPLSILI